MFTGNFTGAESVLLHRIFKEGQKFVRSVRTFHKGSVQTTHVVTYRKVKWASEGK